jgi:hypothetical protein
MVILNLSALIADQAGDQRPLPAQVIGGDSSACFQSLNERTAGQKYFRKPVVRY